MKWTPLDPGMEYTTASVRSECPFILSFDCPFIHSVIHPPTGIYCAEHCLRNGVKYGPYFKGL
jgi:hypothetical protein